MVVGSVKSDTLMMVFVVKAWLGVVYAFVDKPHVLRAVMAINVYHNKAKLLKI